MLIRNIRAGHRNEEYRVEADVELENRKASETLFFAVPSEQADWIAPEPNAFLVGTAMAALWLGETRIAIEGDIDPRLAARTQMGLRLMAHWHKFPRRSLKIEAPEKAHALPDPTRATTALFLSGGVDSLAALYWNTSRYERGDPRRVGVAFFVHGLDVGDPNKMDRRDVWQRGNESLAPLCRSLDVELVPIKVNLRSLAKHWRFYAKWQFGSLLAAIAHEASTRVHHCIISPDNVLEYTQHPHGSHPWLNSYFGADFLAVTSGDMEQFSRLQRIQILAQWPEALDALRVCWDTGAIPAGHVNCGKCPKCVRTMLEFLVCGRLDQSRAFPVHTVTPEMLAPVHIRSFVETEYFSELIEPLREMGRHDLASMIKKKLWLFQAEHALGLNHLRPVAKRLLGRA